MGMVVIANILNALKGEDLTNQVRRVLHNP
jgi:hypothetical protein